MKLLILSLLALLTGCSLTSKSYNPIQVQRSFLKIDRVESHFRRASQVYYIIWTDRRGTEYQEEMKNANDTSWFKKGIAVSQLLKK